MFGRSTAAHARQFTVAIPAITWILTVWFLVKAPYRAARRKDSDPRTRRSAAIGIAAWFTFVIGVWEVGVLP